MRKSNRIPKGHDDLTSFGKITSDTAERIGSAVGLLQNAAPALRADFEAYAGELRGDDPAAPPATGAQAELGQAMADYSQAHVDKRKAVANARGFCSLAVDVLKQSFGRRWNARWIPTGFSGGSLAIPADPMACLHSLTAFLTRFPEHAVEQLGFTLAAVYVQVTALSTALAAVNESESALAAAKQKRNAARARLKRRLSGLRMELMQLLDPADPRWAEFGFRPLAKTRHPDAVKAPTVEVKPAVEGALHVSWKRAPRAESYRVTRQVVGVDEEPVQLGLKADPSALVTGLPPGAEVVIRLSAYNAAGESRTIEVRATLPGRFSPVLGTGWEDWE